MQCSLGLSLLSFEIENPVSPEQTAAKIRIESERAVSITRMIPVSRVVFTVDRSRSRFDGSSRVSGSGDWWAQAVLSRTLGLFCCVRISDVQMLLVADVKVSRCQESGWESPKAGVKGGKDR